MRVLTEEWLTRVFAESADQEEAPLVSSPPSLGFAGGVPGGAGDGAAESALRPRFCGTVAQKGSEPR